MTCKRIYIYALTLKNYLKILFFIFFIFFICFSANSQCVSNQSFTLNPAGPYSPGQVVTVNYSLGNFNGININWIHAFQINLGIGWTNLNPITAPLNPAGSNGNWTWDLQHTYPSGFNFGPGWRFVNSGTAGWGTSSDGPFNMSFQVTVAQTCTPDDLSISMSIFDDCTTGGWTNGSCCVDSLNIYNGVVQVNQNTIPTFSQVGPICKGDLFTLPSSSTNVPAITGSWSPAVNNTSTTTYTFTPNIGQCATTTTMTVVVNNPTTPIFSQVGPICKGDLLTLPSSSTNIPAITGSWSPAVNNTSTTTYTFNPNPGQCGTWTTMTVVVNNPTTPTFSQVGPICKGDLFTLPSSSTNIPAITGSWSPAVNNTSTTTYTFNPNPGQCGTWTTMTVVVNNPTTPTFSQVGPICKGDLFTLPSSSTNIPAITGSWSPAVNNTSTTTYTFNPNPGQCGTWATMTVIVDPVPTVNLVTSPNPACYGDDITLTAITSVNLNLYRFQYNIGNGWQNIITTNNSGWGNINPQYFNNIVTTTQFRVRVRDGWGCSPSPWSTITVPINTIITPPISHN